MILWCDHDDENLGSQCYGHGQGHGENDDMTCTQAATTWRASGDRQISPQC